MRIGICDDNTNDRMNVADLLRRLWPDDCVDTFGDSAGLLAAVSEGRRYDLLFLDIIMPDLSGIELAGRVREEMPEADIVFLTTSESYAVEAFSINALHYLIKPPTEETMKECIRRFEEKNQSSRRQIMIQTSFGNRQMVAAEEIKYCETADHYILFYLKDGSILKSRMTQKELQETLGSSFVLITRGMMVNIDFIRQMGRKTCILHDGREILLSRKYLHEIHEAYAAWVFERLQK